MRATTVSLLLALLAMPSLAGEKPTFERPGTVEALIDYAIKSIVAQDVDGFMALFPGVDEMASHCPEVVNMKGRENMTRMFERFHGKVKRAMAECTQTFDLKAATRLRVEGGKRDVSPLPGCKDFYQVEDINVYFEYKGKTFRLKLDDPYASSTSFGVTDDPRCTEEAPSPEVPVKK